MQANDEGKPENKGLLGKRRGSWCMTFGGKGEMEKLVGSWLVTVTAAGNGRVTLQTLSPCMDCELSLFARDTEAEMPLVSPD